MRMKKRIVLGLLLTSLLAIGFSSGAAAGGPPMIPHVFYGEATVEGMPVLEGAEVAAVSDGEVVASTTVDDDGAYTLEIIADGTVDFHLSGFDTGISEEIVWGGIDNLDLELSMLSVEAPVEMTSKETVTVRGHVVDHFTSHEDIILTVDGESSDIATDGTFESEAALDPGSNEIVVAVEDPVGIEASESFEVVRDVEAPEITIEAPEEGEGFKDTAVNVKGGVDDDWTDSEEIFVTVHGEEVEVGPDGSFETIVDLDDGPQEIEVVAEDLVGNEGSETVSVMVDVEAPDLTILSPDDGEEIPEQVTTVAGEVDDDWTDSEDIVVTVQGEEVEVGPEGSFETEVELEIGPQTIEVTATDGVGNSKTESVDVERVDPVPWAIYGAIVAIVAVVLILLAVWRWRPSRGGL